MLGGDRLASLTPMLLETRALRPAPVPPLIGAFQDELREINRQAGRLDLRLLRDAPDVVAAYRAAFDALLRLDEALNHLATSREGMHIVISDAEHERRKSNASRSIDEAADPCIS
jgi:hypothetical protein